MKKTTYTTTRFKAKDGFYVEVCPNEKNDCYDFYLGHEDYGVKDFMTGELRKNCTPNQWEYLIMGEIDDCISFYKEHYFDKK